MSGGGNSGLETALGIGAAIAAPELMPSLFSGGVGTSALTGMALGAGSSALTGGNVARGALMGGALGLGSGYLDASLAGAGAPQTLAPVSDAGTAVQAAAPTAAGSQGISALDNGLSQQPGIVSPAASNMTAAPTAASAPVDMSQDLPADTGNPGPVSPQTASQAAGKQSFTSSMMNWIKQNPAEAAALGIGGAYTLQGMAKPNYLTPYKPVTYSGLNSTLAAGYQPVRPMASGGITALPNSQQYAVGGKLLDGPGDGMSDSIPANISGNQEARLADGEFVIPADVVSHLGNGSTDAGAKQLYAMMKNVRKARTGNPKQGKQINPQKYMPA